MVNFMFYKVLFVLMLEKYRVNFERVLRSDRFKYEFRLSLILTVSVRPRRDRRRFPVNGR